MRFLFVVAIRYRAYLFSPGLVVRTNSPTQVTSVAFEESPCLED